MVGANVGEAEKEGVPGVGGARNVKTLAIPVWSSSAEHCPSPSSIFQMPGPQHENKAQWLSA